MGDAADPTGEAAQVGTHCDYVTIQHVTCVEQTMCASSMTACAQAVACSTSWQAAQPHTVFRADKHHAVNKRQHMQALPGIQG